MNTASETASITFRALGKCCQEVQPAGKWQWQCALQNGARVPVTASLRDGFLTLACGAGAVQGTSAAGRAMSANAFLHRGAKLALDAAGRNLHLLTDIVIADEAQLFARLQWAVDGLHHGLHTLASLRADCAPSAEPAAAAPAECLEPVDEVIRESGWQFTKRGAGEFAVDLESSSSPPAMVRIDKSGMTASVELVRCNGANGSVAAALSIYLLTLTRTTRLVRATRHSGSQEIFALQAGLPVLPVPEELAHALAALSVAHRSCVREVNALLNETAAGCYLTACGASTTLKPTTEQEK